MRKTELSSFLVYFVCVKIITVKLWGPELRGPGAGAPPARCAACAMVNPALRFEPSRRGEERIFNGPFLFNVSEHDAGPGASVVIGSNEAIGDRRATVIRYAVVRGAAWEVLFSASCSNGVGSYIVDMSVRLCSFISWWTLGCICSHRRVVRTKLLADKYVFQRCAGYSSCRDSSSNSVKFLAYCLHNHLICSSVTLNT